MLQASLSNLLALKVMTVLATLVLIALLFFVRYLGKKLGRTKKNGMYDPRLLSWHRWAVGCLHVLCVGGDFVGDWNLDARFTLNVRNLVPVSLLKAPSI